MTSGLSRPDLPNDRLWNIRCRMTIGRRGWQCKCEYSGRTGILVLGFGCGAVGGLMVHKIALFEIALKYADVMSLEEVVSQL